MATKLECDRCGRQVTGELTSPRGWGTLVLDVGPVSGGTKKVDVCQSCAHAARAFMERLPQAIEASA